MNPGTPVSTTALNLTRAGTKDPPDHCWEMGRSSGGAVLGNGPLAEVTEELCEGGRLIVRVEAAGNREDPGAAAAEGRILQADAGAFVAGDDAVGTDADEGDDGGAPAFDFAFESLPAGAEFDVGELIGAGGSAIDDVGDADFLGRVGAILQRGRRGVA